MASHEILIQPEFHFELCVEPQLELKLKLKLKWFDLY